MQTIKVTLREKKISKNRKSLYLDFYPAIMNPETGQKTRREFLNIYIPDKPKTPTEKDICKERKLLAENIAAKRQLGIQTENYGFLTKAPNQDLLPYFKKLADEQKKLKKGDSNNWISVYKYLYTFTNGKCYAKDITEEFCIEFKKHIQQSKTFVANKNQLANNSAVGYFNIFKRFIKIAAKNKKIETDVSVDVACIRKTDTHREYLTSEEVKLLFATPCDLPVLKRAALFSIYTGLRYSDIEKLTWQEIRHENNTVQIQFIQKKTKGAENLPFHPEALQLLGEPGTPTEKIFKPLLYSAWQNQKIQQWVYLAGIRKKITFHCFRHTYATLLLNEGAGLYTVSKLLGHRSISTSQVYAKIHDATKINAANKISLDLLSLLKP